MGPAPEYPRALRKKRISGSATLVFAIDARGVVADPRVIAATQPEFGDAAMAVIKHWRFLPKVENGQAVPTQAKMPFEFSPAAEK